MGEAEVLPEAVPETQAVALPLKETDTVADEVGQEDAEPEPLTEKQPLLEKEPLGEPDGVLEAMKLSEEVPDAQVVALPLLVKDAVAEVEGQRDAEKESLNDRQPLLE